LLELAMQALQARTSFDMSKSGLYDMNLLQLKAVGVVARK